MSKPFGRPLSKKVYDSKWRGQVHTHPIELGYTCFKRSDDSPEPQWHQIVGITMGETPAADDDLIHLAPMFEDRLGEPVLVPRSQFLEEWAPLGPSIYFSNRDDPTR